MLPKKASFIMRGVILALSMGVSSFAKSIPPAEREVPLRGKAKIARECNKVFTELPQKNGKTAYPKRLAVPNDKRSWDAPYPEYAPPYYRDPSLQGKDWAEPESKMNVNNLDPEAFRKFLATSGDKSIPRNPCGRTGIAGQGLLGKWGENWAADPIITRYDPKTGKLLVLLIKRGDGGEWAIPGGMVDPGETKLSVTAARELKEETGLDVKMDKATEIYEGIVDDSRNTDNSWMMTKAYHLHLENEASQDVEKKALAAMDAGEIKAIQWVPYDDNRLKNLFASHSKFIAQVMKSMYIKQVAPFHSAERASREKGLAKVKQDRQSMPPHKEELLESQKAAKRDAEERAKDLANVIAQRAKNQPQ